MRKEKVAERLSVAMVGGKTSTIGFRALGVDTYTVAHPDDSIEIWDQIPLEKYAVVFVTEPVFQRIALDVAAHMEEGGRLPVITVLPSVAVSEEWGIRDIRKRVVRAVGVDIFGA